MSSIEANDETTGTVYATFRDGRARSRSLTSKDEMRSVVARGRRLLVDCSRGEELYSTLLDYGYDWGEDDPAPTFWVRADETANVDAWLAQPTVFADVSADLDDSCSGMSSESVFGSGTISRASFVDRLWGLQRIAEQAGRDVAELSDEAVQNADVWRIDLSHVLGSLYCEDPEPSEQAEATGQTIPALIPLDEEEVAAFYRHNVCTGCEQRCPLFSPSCGKGTDALYKALAREGYTTKG